MYSVIGLIFMCLAFVLIIIKCNNLYRQEIIKIKNEVKLQLEVERKDAIAKSKSVTRGHISQEFIPLFPDFPYNMSDCKFSGNPIDFLIFKGMSDLRDGKDTEIEIIFADVKVNKSQRSKIQNAIKKAIENKKVRFETWNILENKQLKIK